MSKNSGVEWTDHSWGPWYGGCQPRGPECANCYAKRDMRRYGKDPDILTRSKTTFTAPLKWTDPARVFVCPWSDFFLPETDPWRPEAWDIIRLTPHLRYIIPTKRPELIQDRLPLGWGGGWDNVMLMVSVGTPFSAGRFLPYLQNVKALWRGISAEPLLEPLWLAKDLRSGKIDWLIVGAESGPQRRHCDLAWVRFLVQQAQDAHVPVFVKQLHLDGKLSKDPEQWPADLRLRQFPEGWE